MAGRPHVLILAGGRGERFWPWSRERRPKPFVSFDGRRTLLADAWSRARRLATPSRIWVVSHHRLASAIRSELPQLRPDRLIPEPSSRDTAPAIALAALTIAASDPGAVMIVTPSDHAIDDPSAWVRDTRRALAATRGGALVCLGVAPSAPNPAFGYLVFDRRPGRGVAPVKRFVEKPSVPVARRLLATRRCLWNAGIFAWRVDAFLQELERRRPDIATAARAAKAGRAKAWGSLRPVSVDFAVLEHATDVRAVRLTSGWDDLGSWDVVARRAKPPGPRRALLVDSPGTAVFTRKRFVAVVGVPNVTVVEADDAVLVVARERAQESRRVVAELRRRGRGDLL